MVFYITNYYIDRNGAQYHGTKDPDDVIATYEEIPQVMEVQVPSVPKDDPHKPQIHIEDAVIQIETLQNPREQCEPKAKVNIALQEESQPQCPAIPTLQDSQKKASQSLTEVQAAEDAKEVKRPIKCKQYEQYNKLPKKQMIKPK